MFFDRIEWLVPPPDDTEVIPVQRLHIRFMRSNSQLEGWASLTGRVVEDSNPILEVVEPIKGMESTGFSSQSKLSSVTELSTCPLCSFSFPEFYSRDIKDLHVANCAAEELKVFSAC